MNVENKTDSEKEIKRISLALFQIAEKIKSSALPEAEKKALSKKINEQDKKLLKIHNVKFSDKDKNNLLSFLE